MSQLIDFIEFEETFRLGPAGAFHLSENGTPKALKKSKKQETISLLEPNRLRNVGKLITGKERVCARERENCVR